MVYTDPPVEDACLFCWAVGGLCRELEERERERERERGASVSEEGGEMEILGLVTLSSLPFLLSRNASSPSTSGNSRGADADADARGRSGGWIACTTDAMFLEKPEVYDLLVDLRGVSALGAGGAGARVGGGGLGYGGAYGSGGAKSLGAGEGSSGGCGGKKRRLRLRTRPVMWVSTRNGKKWRLERARVGWCDVKLVSHPPFWLHLRSLVGRLD